MLPVWRRADSRRAGSGLTLPLRAAGTARVQTTRVSHSPSMLQVIRNLGSASPRQAPDEDSPGKTQTWGSPRSHLLPGGHMEERAQRTTLFLPSPQLYLSLPPTLLLILYFLFQLEVSKQLLRGCPHSIPALLRHGKQKEPPERKIPGQRAPHSLTDPKAFKELRSLQENPPLVPHRASRQTDSWIFAPLREFHHSVLD